MRDCVCVVEGGCNSLSNCFKGGGNMCLCRARVRARAALFFFFKSARRDATYSGVICFWLLCTSGCEKNAERCWNGRESGVHSEHVVAVGSGKKKSLSVFNWKSSSTCRMNERSFFAPGLMLQLQSKLLPYPMNIIDVFVALFVGRIGLLELCFINALRYGGLLWMFGCCIPKSACNYFLKTITWRERWSINEFKK